MLYSIADATLTAPSVVLESLIPAIQKLGKCIVLEKNVYVSLIP